MKYTIKQFQREFPNDDACLDYIFKKKYPEAMGFYRVRGRKCYANATGHQIHPVAGTIFEKSATPLTLWFYAIYLFSASRNGVSSKELERQLGVTYKTAWRIGKEIRKLMAQDGDMLSGVVEVDETYIGGTHRMNSKMSNKTPVIGMVERKGRVKASTIPNRQTHIILNEIRGSVKRGSHLVTDEFGVYKKTLKLGYTRSAVKHFRKEFAKGMFHTNSVEGFWSQLKRSIDGTYHAVSPKYLQSYVDEFAFRYNCRTSPVFEEMMARI